MKHSIRPESASEAANDMCKRGLEILDAEPAEEERDSTEGGDPTGVSDGINSTLLESLRAAKLSTWQRVDRRKSRSADASSRRCDFNY